jgi:RHS repeat-associated protein
MQGQFDLQGEARDTHVGDAVAYQVLLHPPGDPYTVIANVTPQPRDVNGFHQGGDNGGDLGTNDFTGIPNGIYDLELIVHGGGGQTNVITTFQLDSQLKIGQFTFSEQDLVLPVNGIPLTVTRTYNSLNLLSSDFGYSWSFALNDMDVQLDDTREDVTIGSDTAPWDDDESGDGGLPKVVNMRTGGGWDVTLTLPDGRRTTFKFDYDGIWPNLYVKWDSPPGVTAKLSMIGNNELVFGYSGATMPTWADSDFITGTAPLENQDIQGWVLQTQDGTKYNITRGSANSVVLQDPNNPGQYLSVRAYGPPKLTSIEQRSGDVIVISTNNIYHQDTNGFITRVISFDRDAQGRITAIYDPNGPNGPAAVQYVYNQDTGNLIQVRKLVDRTAGTYTTNWYDYNNSSFPHYITSIENGDGVSVARNFYDDSGRLTAVQDADGNLTQFIHNLTNDMEVVIDRLGHTNTYVYDTRGNVTAQTNALGQVMLMAYDGNNNKTNEVTYLNGQPYATNSYVYDDSLNVMLSSTDPLGHTSTFTYDRFGNMLASTDARGNTTTNNYDPNTGELTSTVDALGHGTTNFYDANSLLLGSVDAVGTLTTNAYDSSENVIGTATMASDGVTILSTNSFTYDDDGNRLTSTVWRHVAGTSGWVAATTTYIYDAQNRVTQTIDANGGTNTVVYDAVGKPQATIDQLGHTTGYTYDYQGRLVQTAYPDGSTETSAYDPNGNHTNSVDRAGRATAYVYDALNRQVETIYPDGTTNGTVYDDLGRVTKTIDARGTITAFAYDAAGRRLTVTNAFGTAVAMTNFYGYDADGNQITLTDSLSHTTTNVFDALNRQVQTLYPDGTASSTGYDAAGRRVAGTNQDGIVTEFGYDGAGRLTSVTNALQNTAQMITRYQFDEAGNEVAQVDALLRTNLFAYDNLGRRVSHTLPGKQSQGFAYDLAGNLIYQTNFNGVIITNHYDVLNRPTSKSSIGGYSVSFAYSVTGQRTNMVDPSGTTAYLYDIRDRLTNKAVAWNGGTNVALSYAYDANGDVTNIWSSSMNGVNLAYVYDSLSRLTNVLANGNSAASYAFDNAGNLQSLRYGTLATNVYQYDSLNRLTNLACTTVSGTIASFYYQLGLTGNRTNLIEAITGFKRTNSWSYDSLYRLTSELIKTNGGSSSLAYTFDTVGNRTGRTVVGSNLNLTNQTFAFNTNDWLSTDQYDNDGNTTNASGNSYQYDAMDRVTNVNDTIFITYDGDGNRASKTVGGTTTYYLLDDRNPSGYVQVLEEWTSTGTPVLSRVYNYGLTLISQRQPNVSTNYFVYDGHGSTRLLLDAGGNVVNAFAYDAYGTLIASNAAPQTAYLYCGQQFDSDLGLYYLRARVNNPNTGRFLSADSNEGNNEDPLSLHKYLYAQCDPVDNDDPSGHDIGDMLAVADIFTSFAAMLSPVSGGGVESFLAPIADKDHGFAYDVSAKKKGGWGRTGMIGIEKGKTIVESVAGITKFKADIADIRKGGWMINTISIYGHGDGGGTVGDSSKAQIGFSNLLHSPYKNALWGPDLEDMFTGITLPDVVVNLEFCGSLDDPGTIVLLRKIAPKADIFGIYGVGGGWEDYGPALLTHYDK